MNPAVSNKYNPHIHQHHKYQLKVLQQPSKARLCSFREKVDRRPIDPPPIVQLYCSCHRHLQQQCYHDFLHNPYFFLYANLTSITDDTDLYSHHGHRTTAGTLVQSLYKLKDIDNNDGGFFVFADISVRLEGNYRLKFTLFEIVGEHVQRLVSVISNPFTVYSPKCKYLIYYIVNISKIFHTHILLFSNRFPRHVRIISSDKIILGPRGTYQDTKRYKEYGETSKNSR
ncbi:unnamed protein product [Absidia cylindrospora]